MKVYRFFFVNFVNFWKSFLKFFKIFLKFFWNFFEIFWEFFWNFFEIVLNFFWNFFEIFFKIFWNFFDFFCNFRETLPICHNDSLDGINYDEKSHTVYCTTKDVKLVNEHSHHQRWYDTPETLQQKVSRYLSGKSKSK